MEKKRSKLVIIPVAFILFFVLVGCSGSVGDDQGTQPEKIDNTEENDTASNTETFKIGDQVKLGDYIVSVSEIEDPYLSDNEYWQPEDGNKYIAVEVSYDNETSDKTISYNPFDWTLYDSEGYSYDSGFTDSKEPDLSSGDLNPGGKVKGWLTFEVLENAEDFKIQFTPSWLSNDNVEIELY